MNLPSIAFIDLIGLVYDGSTLSKKGLGGSESAVILMSRELAKLGFPVTVFCACNEDDAKPGLYDSVLYRQIESISEEDQYDIVISSRTFVPFVPNHYYEAFKAATRYHPSLFKTIRNNAKYKVMWMHDTFTWGEQNLEDMLINGWLDKVFTLSDFHTSYVTNCDHGKRRNFEVLKNKFWMTRNGIVNYIDDVDITAKDRNLFVYNASYTKGLVPLLDNIWPTIKQHIPAAKLKVIGGYYQFRSDSPLDEQGKKIHELMSEEKYKTQGVEFTGVIKQSEIANILAKANMFLFPGAFPETFGISTLESLNYNTPLVTCRFGAAEETALDMASYFIDYAAVPNGLFPNINPQEQAHKFLQTFFNAYNNTYLHQQKQYYCNVIKDICTWGTVALQWKQHFFKQLGLYLSRDEYREVSYINDKVHRVFNRRFSNKEEWNTYKLGKEQKISVISPFYNAENYIKDCILSVASQEYDNYHHYLINDCSTDNSYNIAKKTINSLPVELKIKFTIIDNESNMGAVYNQIETIRKLDPKNIVMLLDGDDALMPDNNIFNFYNVLFDNDKTEYAYGSCWSLADNIPLIAQPYPKHIKEQKIYRQHKFNWGMPYPHLRVFRKHLVDKIDNSVFKDENGEWFKAGGDNSTFYNIIEQADPNKVVAIQEIFYRYNDKNPLNDYKVHGELQNQNASKITSSKTQTSREPIKVQPVMKKKKVLIAIPTAKYIESTTFKAIFDVSRSDEYDCHFQYFYGYNVDQVRNLIASWMVNGDFDYLFAVDYDISFPEDTLKKLIAHDKDIVSGLYIQRIPGQHTLEIFEPNERGGFTHMPYDKLKGKGLTEIGACGFGCVLVKKEVFMAIPYPHFQYHSALDHKDTFSEDLDFCRKAREKGFKVYADPSILCDHTGSYTFKV